MEDKDLINQTILELQSTNESILERHKDNPTLCMRFDSVFKKLINSLNVGSGSLVTEQSSFVPEPITKVFGKEIVPIKSGKMVLKPLEVDEVEAFRERIQLIYESFPDREVKDLIDSLDEIDIRGVAKIAGIENFDKVAIDGKLIGDIKASIRTAAVLEIKKATEIKKLNK